MQDKDNDHPTEQQLEDEMIERDIEYMDEAFRGEHGEKAQQEEINRRRLNHERTQRKERREQNINQLSLSLGSPALVRSCIDPFDYSLRLKSGEAIRYEYATWHENGWLTLHGIEIQEDMPLENQLPFLAMCGVDVRLEDILWVMDSPSGD